MMANRRHSYWLAVALLLATGACAGPAFRFIEARADERGEVSALLSEGGVNQLLVRVEPGASEGWNGLLFDNRGLEPVRELRAWGVSAVDLLQPPAGVTAPFESFTLLPGERMFISQPEPGRLRASLLWHLPADPRAVVASFSGQRRPRVEPGQDIILRAGGNSWVSWEIQVPFELSSARLGWQSAPARALEVWVSVDGKMWARVGGLSAGADPWREPIDLTSAVKGQTGFFVRLATKPGGETGEVALSRVRIEATAESGGGFRPWRRGINEVAIGFEAPRGAMLETRLLAQ